MQTVMVELPQWLYHLMALNFAVSCATLALKIVTTVDHK